MTSCNYILSIVIASHKNYKNLLENLGVYIAKIHYNTQVVLVLTPSCSKSVKFVHQLSLNYTNLTYYIQPAQGIYSALNYGIDQINSEYILILGADDHLLFDPFVFLTRHDSRPILSPVYLKYDRHNISLDDSYLRTPPLFNNICHQGLILPSWLYKTYPLDQNFKYAADYKQYLLLRKKKMHFQINMIPYVIYNNNGLSRKNSIQAIIHGHREKFLALYATYPFYAILYLIFSKCYLFIRYRLLGILPIY